MFIRSLWMIGTLKKMMGGWNGTIDLTDTANFFSSFFEIQLTVVGSLNECGAVKVFGVEFMVRWRGASKKNLKLKSEKENYEGL